MGGEIAGKIEEDVKRKFPDIMDIEIITDPDEPAQKDSHDLNGQTNKPTSAVADS